MKYNDKHPIYNIFVKYFQTYPQYEFLQEKDFNKVQSIMESEAMELSGIVKIKYSRRPDLIKSFVESKQNPLIIVDESVHSMAVLSQINCNYEGMEQTCFYSSDLRIASKSSLRFKVQFRTFYLNIIKEIPNTCFTAILKQNSKAIDTLSQGKGGLFYNPLVEYLSRSIFILPTILLLRPRELEQNYNIISSDDRREEYLQRKLEAVYFAHEVARDDESFLIMRDDKVKGYFSIKRPQYRSLLVEIQSKILRFGLNLLGKLFKKNYSQKIPWVYLTNLYIDDDISKDEILSFILKYLYTKKIITDGEVFLICSDIKNQYKLKGAFPQVKISGIFFDVSGEKKEEYPDEEFHLNPLFL